MTKPCKRHDVFLADYHGDMYEDIDENEGYEAVQQHEYVNTAAAIHDTKPPIPRRKAATKPVTQETQRSSISRQAKQETKKNPAYVLNQNELLILMLVTGVVSVVISMVIMGIVIGAAVMPKINDNSKIHVDISKYFQNSCHFRAKHVHIMQLSVIVTVILDINTST